jgi:SH3 domain-containing YSC84-like protein 1
MKKLLVLLMFVGLSAPAWSQEDPNRAQTQDQGRDMSQDERKARNAMDDRNNEDSGARTEVVERLRESGLILEQLSNTPDDAIPEWVLARAKCVAVIPNMVKGGFVFGARHGRGVATCRLNNGSWSAPAFLTVTGGSWGAQIGVQSADVVMMFMTEEGARKLMKSNVELGADASVAAGPVGRRASAATDWKLDAQVLTYSRTKGLFAGLTLNGAALRPDDDSTRAFYGRKVPFQQSLTGRVQAPQMAQSFLAEVKEIMRESRARR